MRRASRGICRSFNVMLVSGVLCCGFAVELIKNGDMDSINPKTGLLASWVRPPSTPSDPQLIITPDSVKYHSPPYSMKMTSVVDKGTLGRLIGQEIPLKSKAYGSLLGKTVHVSAWVRDVGVPHVGFFYALSTGGMFDGAWKDLAWCEPYTIRKDENFDTTVAFQFVERTCVIDAKTQAMWLYVGLVKHGTGWIDDASVTVDGTEIQVWPEVQKTPVPVIDWSRMLISDLRGRRVAADAAAEQPRGIGAFIVRQRGSEARPTRMVMNLSTTR